MNAKTTKHILKTMPRDKSIMVAAKHGIGKSSVIKQVTEELGIGFYDVRLSQCEVGDIKGLPYLNEETKRTEFLKPFWWPRDPDSEGILFFDELNRASKDVLQAVFEICLDRRLDGEKLPSGWRVVAAINADDEYDVVELDPALLDRWYQIEFEPDLKEWVQWAIQYGVHPSIIEYVQQNPDQFDPPIGQLQAGEIYPSRRSWVAFHDSCKAMGLWDKPDDALLGQIARGWLGRGIAAGFPQFFMNDYARLKASDVLDDFEEAEVKIEAACADIASIAALSRSVTNEIKKRKANEFKETQHNNLKKFLMMVPKDVASKMWVELLTIPRTKKLLVSWQADPELKEFVKAVYLR